MGSKEELEPIFSRQEQAVVYLFSRYWQRLPEFEGKTITRIHVRFPDFSLVNEDGKEEAIEFEYALRAFRSHLHGNFLRRWFRNQEGDIRRLYIVYWEENDDKDILRLSIRKQAPLDVQFVCLRNSFEAEVRRIDDKWPLRPFWRFTNGKRPKPGEAYSLNDILQATETLGSSIERLQPSNDLYRATGFNTFGSEFIECAHWQKIHFFTTATRMGEERIPRRLFTKPTGCDYFNGYFDVTTAFRIVRSSKLMKEFWKKYYFYLFDPDYSDSLCFVCTFKPLDEKRGRKLYQFLISAKYNLGTRSSVLIESPRHIARIKAILAR
jgi:hypothetical protein